MRKDNAKLAANVLWMFALAMLVMLHPNAGEAGLIVIVTFAAWLIGGWSFQGAFKTRDTPQHTAYELEKFYWRMHFYRREAGDEVRAEVFAIAANELREAFDLDNRNFLDGSNFR